MSRTVARTLMLCAGAAAAGLTMLTLSATGTSNGAVSLGAINAAYTQDFDTLANVGGSNALPLGWALDETGTSAANNGSYATGAGSSNAGDVYSFGASGSTERAR